MGKNQFEDEVKQVEELIAVGREALQKKEFEKALDYFREAQSISPFRKDIRSYIAKALEYSPLKDEDVPVDMPVEDIEASFKDPLRKPAKSKLKITLILSFIFLIFIFGGILFFQASPVLLKKETPEEIQNNEVTEIISSALRLQRDGEITEAIAQLKDAEKINPESEPVKVLLAELYSSLGIEAYSKKKYSDAIHHFESSIAYNPQVAENYYYMGRAYSRRGIEQNDRADHRSAIRYYQKAIQIDTSMAEAYYEAAFSYVKLNELRNAYDYLYKTIEVDSDSVKAREARHILQSHSRPLTRPANWNNTQN